VPPPAVRHPPILHPSPVGDKVHTLKFGHELGQGMAMAKKETQFTPMMARPYYIWR